MKKNGTHFNLTNNPLTLVSGKSGKTAASSNTGASGSEDAAADYFLAPQAQQVELMAEPLARTSHQALVFVLVSVACATAALASGTYAIWLTRRQAAQNALTDVRDLLRTCHDRMVQMEDDLHRLPPTTPQSSAPAR